MWLTHITWAQRRRNWNGNVDDETVIRIETYERSPPSSIVCLFFSTFHSSSLAAVDFSSSTNRHKIVCIYQTYMWCWWSTKEEETLFKWVVQIDGLIHINLRMLCVCFISCWPPCEKLEVRWFIHFQALVGCLNTSPLFFCSLRKKLYINYLKTEMSSKAEHPNQLLTVQPTAPSSSWKISLASLSIHVLLHRNWIVWWEQHNLLELVRGGSNDGEEEVKVQWLWLDNERKCSFVWLFSILSSPPSYRRSSLPILCESLALVSSPHLRTDPESSDHHHLFPLSDGQQQ